MAQDSLWPPCSLPLPPRFWDQEIWKHSSPFGWVNRRKSNDNNNGRTADVWKSREKKLHRWKLWNTRTDNSTSKAIQCKIWLNYQVMSLEFSTFKFSLQTVQIIVRLKLSWYLTSCISFTKLQLSKYIKTFVAVLLWNKTPHKQDIYY